MKEVKKPFFIVNLKSYLFGSQALELAKISDSLAAKYKIDCFFTAQLIDLPMIKENTNNLIITAQSMDALKPGRGMGHILPEGLKAQGVEAVVLNHAENPLTLSQLDIILQRAKDLDLITIVCGDSPSQCRAIGELHPNIMICEPSSLIGTGSTSNDNYIKETVQAIHEVDSQILIMQAAGVSTGADVQKVMRLGADGTGGTSGIIKASSWKNKIDEMMSSLVKFKEVK